MKRFSKLLAITLVFIIFVGFSAQVYASSTTGGGLSSNGEWSGKKQGKNLNYSTPIKWVIIENVPKNPAVIHIIS